MVASGGGSPYIATPTRLHYPNVRAAKCATERWKQHRPECRRLQAVAFGEEYAREEERSYRLAAAAHLGDVRTMRRLTIDLSVAVLFGHLIGAVLTRSGILWASQ